MYIAVSNMLLNAQNKHFKKLMRLPIVSLIIIAAAFTACKHEMVEPGTSSEVVILSSTDSVSFQTQILPLYQSYCGSSGCHSAASAKEGVVTTDYFNIRKGIRSKNLNESEYYTIITSGEMPPKRSAKLSSAQIALIAKWINEGAKNTLYTTNNCNTNNNTYSLGVANIFAANCVGCHNANLASGGIQLHNYNTAFALASGSQTVLLNAINYTAGGSKNMPPAGKLSNCDLQLINQWIANGMPQ